MRRGEDDSTLPVLCIDYAFCGLPGELPDNAVGSKKLPILIVKDRRTKAIAAHPMPAKGASHPYPAKALLGDIERLGYKRVVVESDQEPAIVALVNWSGELVPEGSPKGESRSNGEAERSVQEVQGALEDAARRLRT